jgi:PhnB protein
MLKAHPYLNFDGNGEEALTFYKSILGGEFVGGISKFGDMPESEDYTVSDAEKNRLMHAALQVNEQVVIMASDISYSAGHVLKQGNNNYISLHPSTIEEGERLYKALSEGGKVEMEFQKMFWGDFYAAFTDKYGVQWMINVHQEK